METKTNPVAETTAIDDSYKDDFDAPEIKADINDSIPAETKKATKKKKKVKDEPNQVEEPAAEIQKSDQTHAEPKAKKKKKPVAEAAAIEDDYNDDFGAPEIKADINDSMPVEQE